MSPSADDLPNVSKAPSAELQVGHRVRELRTRHGLSLRALADRSGLNINTLSLIENGKSSPSVSTLQQLAQALDIHISSFFETEPTLKNVVFTSREQRPGAVIGDTQMQNLGKDLSGSVVQPFVVTLKPGMGSGERLIVHTGHEFVYCLEGTIRYLIEQAEYILTPGDSLVFEAHLPHCWQNHGSDTAQILLILLPSDERDQPAGRHLSLAYEQKEMTMKIAVITDDGKSISQHFGRAPYYLVLTIEEGKITHRELRNKLGHHQFSAQEHAGETHATQHGLDEASHNKHAGMADAISDCKALICGGMGTGAYESMRRLNIQPIVTDLRDIEKAVQAFIDGTLLDHTEMLH
ncbi:MAG TPA: NifB/NifX family molybdenum-iron cluster-binding protein [Anaerolineaceae bacterium]|jgi:transcriptional regulator with XRE-family HTH domain/predicted Fe-Mo cluster-binding NifX family protein|nr:NifB/NifX family molybdenum-iron cluster-binding protein [Anaerolineaceae bacterium]